MKKINTFFVGFFSVLLLAACHSGNNPKDVAIRFFTAVNAKKFDEAEKYATTDSKQFLEMLQTMAKQVKDSVPASKEKFIIENVKITGDKATADIKTKSEPKPINISFKKENGQWKVAFDKNSVMKMGGVDVPHDTDNINNDIDKALDSAARDGGSQMPTRKDTQVLQIN